MSYAYTDYKGLSVITPAPPGLPAQTVDANFKILADGLSVAKTIHVAKNGSDTAGNGSLHKPFATVQAAFNSVTAFADHRLIHIGAGYYDEIAVLTIPGAQDGHTQYVTIEGAGRWATIIKGIRIVVTSGANGVQLNLSGLSLFIAPTINRPDDIYEAAPAFEIACVAGPNWIDVTLQGGFIGRQGGTQHAVVVSGSNPPLGFSLNLLDGLELYSRGGDCVRLPFGSLVAKDVQMISFRGREIWTKSGVQTVLLAGTQIGDAAGQNDGESYLDKTTPNIYVENDGTGLQLILDQLSMAVGSGHLVDAAENAAFSVFANDLVATIAGAGGINNPLGSVVLGSNMNAATGGQIPVAAGTLILLNRAASTGFVPATSGHWTTQPATTQSAFDELAARLYALEHP